MRRSHICRFILLAAAGGILFQGSSGCATQVLATLAANVTAPFYSAAMTAISTAMQSMLQNALAT